MRQNLIVVYLFENNFCSVPSYNCIYDSIQHYKRILFTFAVKESYY